MAGLCFCFFALVLFFPFPSDQIGGGFLVCYFFSSLSLLLFVFFGCSDGIEREACVCDHGYERSDLCAEIIIIIIMVYSRNPNHEKGILVHLYVCAIVVLLVEKYSHQKVSTWNSVFIKSVNSGYCHNIL